MQRPLSAALESRVNNGTITVPLRQLTLPDFDQLGFDAYQTAFMYLACHVTSNDPQESRHWPELCFAHGWEHYYSDAYEETNWRSVAETPVTPLRNLALSPATCALHYGPAAFEGTKAFLSARGRVVLFRPEHNARRLQQSAARLLMPKVPVPMFVEAVRETALANRAFIPPFRREQWAWESRNPMCLYVRPLLFGHGPQLGVRPAMDHLFVVWASPVRAYYSTSGMRVLISRHFHRAAPGGSGNVKASGNYVSGLLPTQLARRGYDWREGRPVKVGGEPFHDVLYLDAVHNRYVEEFSGANFLAVTTSGTLVSPQSDSILPGVTRDSVTALAEHLGIRVEHRPLSVEELMDSRQIAEAFCTGNAAVITPIVHLHHDGVDRTLDLARMHTVQRLWDMLVGIQLQLRDDPFGWVEEVG